MATSNALCDTLAEFWAGESQTRAVAFDSYPAPTYNCAYQFWLAGVKSGRFTLDAVDTGTSHRITIPHTYTANTPGGTLTYRAVVTAAADSTDVKTADAGLITVRPDPTYCSHSEYVLTAIRATIEGRADNDQKTVAMGDVQLQFMSPQQLVTWETAYAGRVRIESDNMRKAMGYESRNSVLARFTG